MKIALIMFTIFLARNAFSAESNSALRRSNKLLRFIAKHHEAQNVAFASVIGARCSRYLSGDKIGPCREAVRKMIAILDYDIIFLDKKTEYTETWSPKSFVFVAFKKNLISLLSSAKTGLYLKDLNEELYKFISSKRQKPNVWEITKKHFGNEENTAMAMATLYQDTSILKLHLAYLEEARTTGNQNFTNNKELLSRVIDTINLILDSSEEHYRSLFYPEEIQQHLNRNLYHLYVPLYLSLALEKEGQSKDQAYYASLFLTLTYEFITSANDYRYLYKDPAKIDSHHTIQDIYGGYCGANIGVRGLDFYKNFQVIHESFLRSTSDSVQLLIKH